MLATLEKSNFCSSRLMQNPLGAAFARKVLRCKARDEGRTLVLFDEARNAVAGHFSCKPFGAVLGGAICFVASLANSPAIRLRLASRISPRQAAPRPHGVLHQPANLSAGNCIASQQSQLKEKNHGILESFARGIYRS